MHIYLVMNCKTTGCEMQHVLKHLGEKAHLNPCYPIDMELPFPVSCPNCGASHNYLTDDLLQVEMDAPPPPGWTSII